MRCRGHYSPDLKDFLSSIDPTVDCVLRGQSDRVVRACHLPGHCSDWAGIEEVVIDQRGGSTVEEVGKCSHGVGRRASDVPLYPWRRNSSLMRSNIAKLNKGDYQPLLKLASPDFELAFPGDNSWSTMFGPIKKGRERHVTHRGIEQGTAFAEKFVTEGVQFEVEDILVNGPPWNTRVALRVRSFIPGPTDEGDSYNNRAIALLEIRWGRLVRWEDYEDTERIAAWDTSKATDSPPASG